MILGVIIGIGFVYTSRFVSRWKAYNKLERFYNLVVIVAVAYGTGLAIQGQMHPVLESNRSMRKKVLRLQVDLAQDPEFSKIHLRYVDSGYLSKRGLWVTGLVKSQQENKRLRTLISEKTCEPSHWKVVTIPTSTK